jgi:hypothetical protein
LFGGVWLGRLAAQRLQNASGTDGKAGHGHKSKDWGELGVKMSEVGPETGEGKQDAEQIEPERGVDGPRLSKAQLQYQRQEADGGKNDDRQRAAESASARIDNDQSQDTAKETGENNCPAPGMPAVVQVRPIVACARLVA